MGIISVSLPSDGSTADVADYNTPVTTIVNAINGNLDSTNISSLSGTKITAGTIPGTALDSTAAAGYVGLATAPNIVVYNGNHSYTLTWNSVNYSTLISAGMRLRTTRTVAAPTQCTSLNGSTQYYSKSSPAGMTFTDDFVVGAWIKPTSYATGVIASRYNGTSGWELRLESSGVVSLYGYNASASNLKNVQSYQSVPLNKWTHVTAQLDMSAISTNGTGVSTTTNYVMIDGVDVPATTFTGGTGPAALIQAGNLEIGSRNGGTNFFPGKIAQAFVTSAKVTQATIQSNYYSQSISPTETSVISAYSFNNTLNDLNTTNANNLTANGSAVATNTDSPFGTQADGSISSTLDYAEVASATFSTNTTVVVRVMPGNTIPTSGGVSAVVYSSNVAPYGCPSISNKLSGILVGASQVTSGSTDLFGWTTTVVVPTNVTEIEVKILLNAGSAVSNTQWQVNVVETATTVRTFYGYSGNGSNAFTYTFIGTIPVTPGTHTYKLSFSPTGSNITTQALSAGFYNELIFSKA